MTPPEPAPDTANNPTIFRFKTKRAHSPSSDATPAKHRRSHHHRRHHRSKRRSDNPPIQEPISTPPLSPRTSFRESLFDALADDEGAAFWEGVYGQPIHTYSPYVKTEEGGELERMSDEEYTAYVRAKMWEKSHEHLVEERMRREEERAKRKKREGDWEREVTEAVRRGEERRRVREKNKAMERWRGVWEGYLAGWERGKGVGGDEKGKIMREVRELISWPVESGKFKDVGKDEVEMFLRNVPQTEEKGGVVDLPAVLKAERVRWHPDKMQQRFGNLGIDEGTMKAITAVFQVIDRMWSEARPRK